MTEREIELQAKLKQAERALAQARDGAFANIAEAEVIKLANRAAAAESALAAAQGALREERAEHHAPEDDPFETNLCVGCPHGTYPCDRSRRLNAALAAESGKPGGEAWRRLLFLRHGCTGPALYGDDGELQCKACGIDFRRDMPEQIEARWREPRAAPPALPAEPGGEAHALAAARDNALLREDSAFQFAKRLLGDGPNLMEIIRRAAKRLAAGAEAPEPRPALEAMARALREKAAAEDAREAAAIARERYESLCEAAAAGSAEDRDIARAAEPRAAPPALPAELSGKGEQRAYSHEHVFDTQLLCKVCGGCALDLAEEAKEAAEPVMGWSAWCDHLTAVHEKFRSEVKRLLADGIGPGGGYYAEDQRLTAAVGLLGVGWGACPVKEPGEAKKEEP